MPYLLPFSLLTPTAHREPLHFFAPLGFFLHSPPQIRALSRKKGTKALSPTLKNFYGSALCAR